MRSEFLMTTVTWAETALTVITRADDAHCLLDNSKEILKCLNTYPKMLDKEGPDISLGTE